MKKRKVLWGLGAVVALPLLALGALFAIREPPDGRLTRFLAGS